MKNTIVSAFWEVLGLAIDLIELAIIVAVLMLGWVVVRGLI